jgi:N-acylneuraminate cytidylyltransferase
MIAHAIRTAIATGCFARIVVSTDDTEIADIARQHAAETPFIRDAALADDLAGTAEVVADAIVRTGSQDVEFTCCIYPATPLLRPSDISGALEKLTSTDAPALLSVTEFDYPPLRALAIKHGQTLSFNWPEYERTRSQDLPELVHDAGQFYWMRTARFLENPRLVPAGTIGYAMDRIRCVDIDTEADLEFAEALFAYHSRKS